MTEKEFAYAVWSQVSGDPSRFQLDPNAGERAIIARSDKNVLVLRVRLKETTVPYYHREERALLPYLVSHLQLKFGPHNIMGADFYSWSRDRFYHMWDGGDGCMEMYEVEAYAWQ